MQCHSCGFHNHDNAKYCGQCGTAQVPHRTVQADPSSISSSPALSTPIATHQVQTSLECLVKGLVAREYTFVTPDVSPEQMHERLAKFDEGRLNLSGKVFGFMVGGSDLPAFAKVVTKHIVAFGAEEVQDAELAALQQLMQSTFPLCAFAFSTMYGPRFAAIVNGDDRSQTEIFEMMDRFQQINIAMMHLGGRLSVKLLGKSIMGINGSTATGSLIVVAATTEQANLLRQWVSSKPLLNDTFTNQMKERFTRWQFWAKAAIGMIEYKPHQLRQEVIVFDSQANQATSTATPRLAFEFGFSFDDIARRHEL